MRQLRSLTWFFSWVCLAAQAVLGQGALADADPYPYPYTNPWVATLSSIWLSPQKLHFQEAELTLYPERSKLNLIGQRNRLTYSYSLQSNPSAPLIFVFSGLGGSSVGGISRFLAEQAYDAGYSVVTLPSSTHWSFALAASESGRIGYLPQDARDQLRVLSRIRRTLKRRYDIRPSEFNLLGFSYGTLDAAFVAAGDLQQRKFQFKKILLINPPIDRGYAIRQLDYYHQQGLRWSEQRRESILSLALGQITQADSFLAEDIFSGDSSGWLSTLNDSERAWLIGLQFRNSLRDVLYVGQQIQDDGILKTPADEFHQNLRLEEARGVTFERYLQIVVFPYWRKRLGDSQRDLEQDCSLMKAVNEIALKGRADQKLYLFYNQDDFLFHPSQAQYLERFPGQLRSYPLGGHLGNLWFSKNIDDIRSALSLSKSE